MRISVVAGLIVTLSCMGMQPLEAQMQTNAAAGGGGGRCDERCINLTTPFSSGWACSYSPGLGEGWGCSASTEVCMIFTPIAGCPFALLESAFRTDEQYVQLCKSSGEALASL